MAKLSIVLPVKNEEKHLQQCVESIINQSFTEWELIAINDYSIDRSWEILQKFALQEARIKAYKNNTPGLIGALNMALEKSSGHIVHRMDADDIMLEGKLSHLIENLTHKGKGYIAQCGVKYFCDDGLQEGYEKYEKWLNALIANGSNFSQLYKECVIPSPAWAVYKTDLILAGGFEGNCYPEDYDLCFRFLKAGLKPIPSSFIGHLWRDHPNRSTRTSENYKDNLFAALKVNHFKQLHYKESSELLLWGAGKKGKKIAKELIAAGLKFSWFTNNENKIGHNIYDITIEYQDLLAISEKNQIIMAISNPKQLDALEQYCLQKGLQPMKHLFLFV